MEAFSFFLFLLEWGGHISKTMILSAYLFSIYILGVRLVLIYCWKRTFLIPNFFATAWLSCFRSQDPFFGHVALICDPLNLVSITLVSVRRSNLMLVFDLGSAPLRTPATASMPSLFCSKHLVLLNLFLAISPILLQSLRAVSRIWWHRIFFCHQMFGRLLHHASSALRLNSLRTFLFLNLCYLSLSILLCLASINTALLLDAAASPSLTASPAPPIPRFLITTRLPTLFTICPLLSVNRPL